CRRVAPSRVSPYTVGPSRIRRVDQGGRAPPAGVCAMSRTADRLRALAVRVCDQRTMERVVDPLVADLEMGYADAISHGSVGRGRWILIAGYSIFLRTITLWHAEQLMPTSRAWTIHDRDALSRVLKFSAAAAVIAALALVAPPAVKTGLGVSHL